ncbi:CoA binding domain protein [Pseudoroseomonas cervicalis ATCC 49957]|uniref:CoA binding domain protein n=1 Tax=Pseudoroseomonas cervicalis ATCC 49957 TaxID=525371 RepID=D5RLW3_9PROT|nr:acetate--CoA ligase family protein [Pseudoroseomonas cervicalis]EFH11699.1 CoA binding domain protein [Pseudoroseomonas cervicalis ATCC 49957]
MPDTPLPPAAALPMGSLSALLAPRSVAVIGASGDATRIGGRPIAYMQSLGYQGRILPVNPKHGMVQGLPAFASVAELPEVPEAAIIAVPAAAAGPALQQLAERGVKAAIMFSAGFAEMGEAGEAEQDRMVAAARAHGMRLLGPNCLGLFNARTGFYGTFTSSLERGTPKPGPIGIASQSGAYGMHLFGLARDHGLGLSCVVTTGNEADLNVGHMIGWMAQDPDTEVIAAYAEGIRDAESFLAALELARRNRKPVVMMKVGRSAVGSAAARSHTASIAGDDAVTDAVLAEYGVVRARTTEEMLDIARLAARRIYPAGNSLGVLTISGGAGVLISDAAEAVDLPMPPMPEAAQQALRDALPYCAPQNPVDCTAQALNDLSLVGTFAKSLVEQGGYSSILSFFTHAGGAASVAPRLRQELAAVRAAHPDRLFVLSVLAEPEMVRQFEADGFTVFEDPSRAVAAIHAMGRYGESFARAAPPPPAALPPITLPATTPSEAEAKRILAQAGIPAAPEETCATAEAAVAAAERIGFPVVLKILSPDILHKSEIGGVLLNVSDAAAVREGFSLLLQRAKEAAPAARIEGVLVAKQLSGGVECILGVHRDPVFGPVAMFGLGGIFVEILKDVSFRRCPFGEAEAEEMIRSIKGFPLLAGARGRPPADIDALKKMLSRLSVFAHQAGPRLAGIDLNPVFAMPAGQGAFAADAVIDIAEDAP